MRTHLCSGLHHWDDFDGCTIATIAFIAFVRMLSVDEYSDFVIQLNVSPRTEDLQRAGRNHLSRSSLLNCDLKYRSFINTI